MDVTDFSPMEVGRGKREEGRGKKEEGRRKGFLTISPLPLLVKNPSVEQFEPQVL